MLNSAEIIREVLPLTKEIKNCGWKRQHWQFRVAKLEKAIEDFNAGKVIDWEAHKLSGLSELINKKAILLNSLCHVDFTINLTERW